MSTPLIDQVISFSGICQATALVQQIAKTGQADNEALQTTLSSILVTDPKSTEDVFGGSANLKLGINTLVNQLNPSGDSKDAELTRYVVNLLSLERKVSQQRGLLAMLGERISQVKRQVDHNAEIDAQVVRNMAAIYSDLISPLGPRIQVAGSPTYLKQDLCQNQIRASLLAGLRAAVLWRQVGGKRRQLLLSRKKILDTARYLQTQVI
ncbi:MULTISPECIES: high frequency lysogenization protein HflD [Corallincola]|uniref:High frequency lysogenization protein HflD homolog n=2 Tax=Corallincola TaxID=1775176 RepID=A0ABY1WUN7_9GAMM|nr:MULTISPECIES: high frequency lysogenization protein HflD [Corallincola]TAA48392.1 lysogenization regulator HflD [Corallincola spongiicola]TCI01341.1 lysogenization regulator HflD [Corallincola luteus]